MSEQDNILRLRQHNQNTLLGGRTTVHYLYALHIAGMLPVTRVTSGLPFHNYWESIQEKSMERIKEFSRFFVLDEMYIQEVVRKLMEIRCCIGTSPYHVLYETLPGYTETLNARHGEMAVGHAFNGLEQLFPDLRELMVNGRKEAMLQAIRDRLADSVHRLTKLELQATDKCLRDVVNTVYLITDNIENIRIGGKGPEATLYAELISPALGLRADEVEALVMEYVKLYEDDTNV